ncbi:MAG: Omp28-related outer membrane protein, partial [Bacteroidales bacterium]|nr:Omp28-related outer membrane protein [Bacteroidales bacterium]
MKRFFIPIISLCLIAFTFTSCDPKEPEPEPEPKPKEEIFVSKTSQNRNVLFEEFTGIGCQFCPNGHRITDSLATLYKGNCFHINVHAGKYAEGKTPDLTTTEGNELLQGFMDGSGYPTGLTNRFRWNTGSSNTFCMHPAYFPGLAIDVRNMTTYVNVAAKTTIEKSSGKLTCKVQAYYTNNPGTDTTKNLIHIAILQNNIKGPQSGGSKYPAMWDGTTYTHNHVLRTYITGFSGEEIPVNKKDSLYSKTFTYTIPATLGLGNVNVV